MCSAQRVDYVFDSAVSELRVNSATPVRYESGFGTLPRRLSLRAKMQRPTARSTRHSVTATRGRQSHELVSLPTPVAFADLARRKRSTPEDADAAAHCHSKARHEEVESLQCVEAEPDPVPEPVPTSCSICLCELADGISGMTHCGHHFHLECLSRWMQADSRHECPNCRCFLGGSSSRSRMFSTVMGRSTGSKAAVAERRYTGG